MSEPNILVQETTVPLQVNEQWTITRPTGEAIDAVMADIGTIGSASFTYDPHKPMRISRKLAEIAKVHDAEITTLMQAITDLQFVVEQQQVQIEYLNKQSQPTIGPSKRTKK